MNITKGKIPGAVKCVLYGVEGIGKSTFASQAPDPLFIDTEGSTKMLDVSRFDRPTNWDMLLAQVIYVIENPTVCKTLVIDTLDWAEKLALHAVLSKFNKKGIEEFGYGKGYVYLNEEFSRLPKLLSEVVERGVNVLLTAHAALRKFEQPDEQGAYDRWEMKLLKQNAPMIKEWADLVLFANYKTYVVGGDDKSKGKAKGGKRVMYTTHNPCWDAKNRHGLADELPLDFRSVAELFGSHNQQTEPLKPEPKKSSPLEPVPEENIILDGRPISGPTPEPNPTENADIVRRGRALKRLEKLMKADNISVRDIQEAVGERGYFPKDMLLTKYPIDFIENNLIAAWDQVKELVLQLRNEAF